MDIDVFLHMGKIEEEEQQQRSHVCCEIRDSKLFIRVFY
jgi:hypothetical protein